MTTNPRIEAAARAICRANGQNPDEPDYDFLTDCVAGHAWRGYIPHATAALAAADAAAWRPVEGAPHGEEVLLFSPAGLTSPAQMEVGCASHGWRRGSISNMSYHGTATHFQPLPPPPQPAERE